MLDALREKGQLRPDEKRIIVRVYYALHKDSFKRNPTQSVDAINRTAALLGVGRSTVGKLITKWNKTASEDSESEEARKTVLSKNTKASRPNKTYYRVPNSREVFCEVRNFITEKRAKRAKVCSPEVFSFLVDKGYITVSKDTYGVYKHSDYKAALKTVQRYLNRKGFLRGKRQCIVHMNPKHIAWRNSYIRTIIENRMKPKPLRLREVYMDESYVHHHYHHETHNLFHPSHGSTNEKTPHKGRRYCFVAAIGGEGLSSNPGLIEDSVWVFSPTNKKGHVGDYHKVFNRENYTHWFKTKLLPNLQEPSLIILDNAKYHKCRPIDTPNVHKLKKLEVLCELRAAGTSYESNISAVEAKLLLREWQVQNIAIEIVQLVEQNGHSVLFTPPYYSDLQPIELIWARIKSAIAKDYSRDTTFKEVGERLLAQFEVIKGEEEADIIGSVIDHVDKHLNRFLEEIYDEEQAGDNTNCEISETESDSSSVVSSRTITDRDTDSDSE